MYALTIWQPWADAITRGTKRAENRPWPAPRWVIGETIAIHAGRHYDRYALPPPGMSWPLPRIPPGALPLGAVVATALVTSCHHSRQANGNPRCQCSPWAAPGQYHWQLGAVRALPEPIPARGYQRLWRLPAAVLAELSGQAPAEPVERGRAA